MSVVPKKPIDRVQWYEDHIAPFTTNATAIGVTTTEVTDLQTKTDAARAAFTAQQVAQQSAKAATEAFHNAVEAMSVAGQALLKKVRAKAEQTGNPAVYTMAQVPAPAIPQPKGAPGKASNFTATMDDSGLLNLAWKCSNPAGTTGTLYQVWRRTNPNMAFEYVGGVGEKKFVDETIPAGASQVTYQIQAVRSTAVGPWAQFNVNFGAGVVAGVPASVSETAVTPKIAA